MRPHVDDFRRDLDPSSGILPINLICMLTNENAKETSKLKARRPGAIALRADLKNRLLERIRSRLAVVTVVGLGHVGLPLTIAFAKAGYQTIGVDNNEKRLVLLERGEFHIKDDLDHREVTELIGAGKLRLTKEIRNATKEADCIEICVPTPVNAQKTPDISIISHVLRIVGQCLSPGQIVVVESTVYPGFTNEVARDLLESKGLKCGIDFSLAYSPERIDPGNRRYGVTLIPKIVGGFDELSGEIATRLYESVIQGGVVQVSNARTAECTKMLENVYRFANIALVDEFALFCERIGVNVFEVVSAASSKPFGYNPHYPGPGIGGPCIPKDPFYLQYAARKVGLRLSLVEASVKVNRTMSATIASKINMELRKLHNRSPKVTVFGLAYKAESSNTINSPAIAIISKLRSSGATLKLYDPYVPSIEVDKKSLKSEQNAKAASAAADCLLFLVDHEVFKKTDLRELKANVAERCILFDAKNLFNAQEVDAAGFRYIGLGKPETRLSGRLSAETKRHDNVSQGSS